MKPAFDGPTGGVEPRPGGESCATSSADPLGSGKGLLESSKVTGVVDKIFGPTCRSAGLLTGQVHLTGTSSTLVGGDPWVPMSLFTC
jgi:hypothetical protein